MYSKTETTREFDNYAGKIIKSIKQYKYYDSSAEIEFTDGSKLYFGALGDDATYLDITKNEPEKASN